MLGLNRGLDCIQGCRPVFVFGNPIIKTLCATVGFSDVTSANIVGYADNNLVDGSKAVAVPFVQVGLKVDAKEGIHLSDLIPLGQDVFTEDDNMTVQILNEMGGAKDDIVYTYHKGDTGRYYKNNDGWYDALTFIEPGSDEDIFIPYGTGLWVSGSASFKFTNSGEVKLDTYQTDLVDGSCLVSNPFPTPIKLSALIPLGQEVFTEDDNMTVQLLNEMGGAKDDIVYTYHKGDTGRYYKNNDGWYDALTFIEPDSDEDITIPAGEALWVSGSSSFQLKIVTPFEELD